MKTKKLLMMCLLVVAVICACTVRVNALEEYQESTATIFDEGGDYSLYYILNNFNHFVETNAKAGHTIGAVAVGGDASYINGNGKLDYTQTTSSYLKGNINAIVSDGFFKNLYVGEINRERTYNHQNDEHTFISKDDSYINFDEAFASIQAEANSFVGTGDYKITTNDLNCIPNPNNEMQREHWKLSRIIENGQSKVILTVDAGYSYEFDEGVISELAGVNLMYSGGITSQTDTMLISNDTGSVSMPYIYLNGQFDAITKMGLVGSHEWGEGLSVVTVLPRATEAIDKDSNQVHIGHVVAPNAYVHNMNGDINGCIVSKSLDVSNGESHMWPYSGYRIRNNSSQPSKPSNPVQPGNSQGENKNPEENNSQPGNATSTNPQPGKNNDNNGLNNENTSNENSNTGTETLDPKSNNDTNNSSTNNEIISNKEELTTNISRIQNTPKISSNKNSKVIVENNKQTNAKQKDSVKTGDNTHLLMYVLFELLAFVSIVSLRKKA